MKKGFIIIRDTDVFEEREEAKPEPPTPIQPVDSAGRPRRMPNEDELTWRMRWRRWQVEQQQLENSRINFELKTPHGRPMTPDTATNRRKKMVSDALGFNPFANGDLNF